MTWKRTFLEVASMVVTRWIVTFWRSDKLWVTSNRLVYLGSYSIPSVSCFS